MRVSASFKRAAAGHVDAQDDVERFNDLEIFRIHARENQRRDRARAEYQRREQELHPAGQDQLHGQQQDHGGEQERPERETGFGNAAVLSRR